MQLEIIDLEMVDVAGEDEHVATVYDDGTINAVDPIVEDDIDNCLGPNREAPYRDSEHKDTQDGDEPIIIETETLIDPGDPGYLAIVSEVLPHPYRVDWDAVETDRLEDPHVHTDSTKPDDRE